MVPWHRADHGPNRAAPVDDRVEMHIDGGWAVAGDHAAEGEVEMLSRSGGLRRRALSAHAVPHQPGEHLDVLGQHCREHLCIRRVRRVPKPPLRVRRHVHRHRLRGHVHQHIVVELGEVHVLVRLLVDHVHHLLLHLRALFDHGSLLGRCLARRAVLRRLQQRLLLPLLLLEQKLLGVLLGGHCPRLRLLLLGREALHLELVHGPLLQLQLVEPEVLQLE
mmetsp:Transcript_19197/g.49579  ORF Transcript_19197/g.49579 Transcript_19197/m.49579 type:complete len:220 (-) Transcript_19197:771-1430(-)